MEAVAFGYLGTEGFYIFADDLEINKSLILLSANYEMRLQVTKVILGDGRSLSTSLVVVGIGARPNLGPFRGLLEEEKGGFKVNSSNQISLD